MLRIYLTSGGIEGYHEGCSCCSATEYVGLKDIKELISKLDNQKASLEILAGLVEKHGKDKVLYWYKVYKNLREVKKAVECGIKYKKDNTLQGTYYKDCYKRLGENTARLTNCTKEYSKLPRLFRKYISITQG